MKKTALLFLLALNLTISAQHAIYHILRTFAKIF